MPPSSNINSKLLDRDSFRDKVFARDLNRCVICQQPGQDAHHIIERRLWTDGGYYLDNGATLCGYCHIKAETTEIDCDTLRRAIGISHRHYPEHFYNDEELDKWGNILLPNGQRLKGELFQDESVQKILALGGKTALFRDWVKYPRTYHLPCSPGLGDKDKVQEDLSYLEGQEVVVTVKMDGENTTMYRDYIHARSLDGRHHPSRSWVKQLQATIGPDIPEGWRICGENLYAKHSIHYQHIPNWFMVFSVWNNHNVCLSWDETEEWAALLGLPTVFVLWRGTFDYERIKALYQPSIRNDEMEGFIVRTAARYPFNEFRRANLKYVRANHVQTNQHWLNDKTTVNKLHAPYQ